MCVSSATVATVPAHVVPHHVLIDRLPTFILKMCVCLRLEGSTIIVSCHRFYISLPFPILLSCSVSL